MLSALLTVTCLLGPSIPRVQFEVNLDRKIEFLKTYDEEKVEFVNFATSNESVSQDLKKVDFAATGENGSKLLFDLEVQSQSHFQKAHVILNDTPVEANCYVSDQND